MLKTTVKDIAKEANVSTATVSLALSGKKTRISEATQNRIIEVAKRLNYKPNLIAQSLVTNKTKTLGMIIPNFIDQIFTHFASGLEKYGRENGYSLLICNSDNSAETCIQQIKLLESRGVEGMAIIPPADINETRQHIELRNTLEKSMIPYILVDRAVHNLYHDYVASDNIEGGYLAGEHLAKLGHKKIGVIAGLATEYGTIKRLKGFKGALKNYKIPENNELIVYSDYTVNGGYEAAKVLFQKHITAIFALNDMMAIGVYKAAAECNVRIPEDVSVVGYDNNPSSSLVHPPLTTISQPFQVIGRRACEILLERIINPDKANCDYFFTPTLVVRESTRTV